MFFSEDKSLPITVAFTSPWSKISAGEVEIQEVKIPLNPWNQIESHNGKRSLVITNRGVDDSVYAVTAHNQEFVADIKL